MSIYTIAICKNLCNRNIIRTPKGMTYRIVPEEHWEYGDMELWNYINRDGGIQH